MQQKWAISQLDCDVRWKVDCIQQPAMTSLEVELRRGSKALSKAKLVPKKSIMVTVQWFVDSLIHYSFQNPGETIIFEKYAQQMNEMHWKLQCLQPALVNRKGSILLNNPQLHIAQPTLQKLSKLGYRVSLHLLEWASQVATVVKSPPVNGGDARDVNLIPESGRSPGVGNSNLL